MSPLRVAKASGHEDVVVLLTTALEEAVEGAKSVHTLSANAMSGSTLVDHLELLQLQFLDAVEADGA